MAYTQNDLGIKRFMAALGSEHYVVMIDPGSFIDVIPFGSWPIEVLSLAHAQRRGCQ
jgi:sensor c-di-GMP phosphodiesterase-like protein